MRYPLSESSRFAGRSPDMREIPYPPPRAVKYPGIMDQQANYGERGASLAGGWRWLAPAFESIWRKAVPARTV